MVLFKLFFYNYLLNKIRSQNLYCRTLREDNGSNFTEFKLASIYYIYNTMS